MSEGEKKGSETKEQQETKAVFVLKNPLTSFAALKAHDERRSEEGPALVLVLTRQVEGARPAQNHHKQALKDNRPERHLCSKHLRGSPVDEHILLHVSGGLPQTLTGHGFEARTVVAEAVRDRRHMMVSKNINSSRTRWSRFTFITSFKLKKCVFLLGFK